MTEHEKASRAGDEDVHEAWVDEISGVRDAAHRNEHLPTENRIYDACKRRI